MELEVGLPLGREGSLVAVSSTAGISSKRPTFTGYRILYDLILKKFKCASLVIIKHNIKQRFITGGFSFFFQHFSPRLF